MAREYTDAAAARLACRVVVSPLGPLLLAASARGVALVEYLDAPDVGASRRLPGRRTGGASAQAGLAVRERELLEFLDGRRQRLAWPLDLGLARGDFDRAVLAATACIPYAAVTSYGAVARAIGRPTATRAVAQALRWNPVPIVIPCHRVVGSAGALTGYAGDRVALKQRLLGIEGVPVRALGGRLQVACDTMYAVDAARSTWCRPDCAALGERTALAFVVSPDAARAAGARPCPRCRPDLNPLRGLR